MVSAIVYRYGVRKTVKIFLSQETALEYILNNSQKKKNENVRYTLEVPYDKNSFFCYDYVNGQRIPSYMNSIDWSD